MRKVLLLVIMFTSFVVGSGGAFANDEPRTIRVGIFQNAPLVFQNDRNTAEGLYVDLLNEIARREGWRLIYSLDTWNRNLEKLADGHIDLMTSITSTPERMKIFDFSSENILTMWGQVYVQELSNVETILDLADRQVAILKGGINGINFKKQCAKFDVTCRFVEKGTYDEVVASTENGDVAAGIVNSVKGAHFERVYDVKKSPIMFDPFSLLFATPRGKSDFLPIIDRYIAEWKQDKESFYFKTYDRWLKEQPDDGIAQWQIVAACFGGGLGLFLIVGLFLGRRRGN